MGDRDDEFREKLQGLGLEDVLRLRAKGVYGERKRPIVDEWIASQERELSESSRQEELDIKRRNATVQITTAVVQITTAVMAIIGTMFSVIAFFL